MKPWAWLLLSILTVAGSVYVLKKPDASPEPTSSDPSLVVPPPPMVGDSLSQPRQPGQPGQNVPLNRNIPAPRGPVTGNSDNMGANPPQSPPNNEENNPSYPTIPPPPPPPGSPFPDAEPPEYYDGDSVPPTFEPPPPLDESGGFVPPPPPSPIEPEGVE